MENNGFADEVYQPEPGEIQEDTGVLDPADSLDDRGLVDPLDEGYSPPERPLELGHFGLTAEEALRGETLDQRITQEEPDVWAAEDPVDGDETDFDAEDHEVGGRRSGRLVAVEDDEGGWGVAQDVGIDGAAASAEEAAMHVIDPDETY